MKSDGPGATVSRAEFLNLFAAVFLPMFMAGLYCSPLSGLELLRDRTYLQLGHKVSGAVLFALTTHMDVVQAFHRAFLVAAGIAALGVFVASRVPRVKL